MGIVETGGSFGEDGLDHSITPDRLIRDLRRQVGRLVQQLGTARYGAICDEVRIADLQTRLGIEIDKTSPLGQENAALRRENAGLKTYIAELEPIAAELEPTRATLQETLDSNNILTMQNKTLRTRLYQAEDQRDRETDARRATETQIQRVNQRTQQADEGTRKAEDRARSFKAELVEERRARESSEDKVSIQTRQLNTQAQQLGDERRRTQRLETKLQTSEERRLAAEQRIGELTAELVTLETKGDQRDHSLDVSSDPGFIRVNVELERLQEELARKDKQLEHYQGLDRQLRKANALIGNLQRNKNGMGGNLFTRIVRLVVKR